MKFRFASGCFVLLVEKISTCYFNYTDTLKKPQNSKAEDLQTLYRVIVLEDEPHHDLFDKNEPPRLVEYNDTAAVRLKRQRNVPQERDHYNQIKDGDEFDLEQIQTELQEHFRGTSYDENPSSTGSDTFRMESMPELRRCRSEVATSQSTFNADGDNNNENSQVPTIAHLASSSQDTADKSPPPPPLVAQSALTAKDKIQARILLSFLHISFYTIFIT